MRQCADCGAENPPDASFCWNCGRPMETRAEPPPTPEPAPPTPAPDDPTPTEANVATPGWGIEPQPAAPTPTPPPDPPPAPAPPPPAPTPQAAPRPTPPVTVAPHVGWMVGMADNDSGQGERSVLPRQLQGWNWGAFFLNWLWGIFNGVLIALLSLVPFVGIVMPFVLGAKGSEWAWKNKRWDSVDHFRRVQRQWALAGVLVFVVGLVVSALVGAWIVRSVTNDDVIESARGDLAVTVPPLWKQDPDLNPEADVAVSHRSTEKYLIVLTDPKADLADIGIERYSDVSRQNIMASLSSPKVISGPEKLVIQGQSAVQYVFQGNIDQLRVVYIHTVIETESRFIQVLAWTLPSYWEENREELLRVTSSVREI